jgi:transcriptional regulator with XRE-family HTH domain
MSEKPAQSILGRALDGLAVVEPIGDDTPSHTERFMLRTPITSFEARTLWAGAGWPADVRRVTGPFEDDWPPDLVLVARHLSPGSIEFLDQLGANWADGSGAARIIGDGILVARDSVQTQPDTNDGGFSWSPSALSIAETVLSRGWSSGIGTTDLAELTSWSPPQVSQVLQAFDAEGWTAKWGPQRGPKSRRELADIHGLLDAWAKEVASERQRRRLAERIFADPLDFLRRELGPVLDRHVNWAVTGWAAAEKLAPFTTTVPSLQIYVPDSQFTGALTQAMAEASVSEVAEGGRIEFRSGGTMMFDLVKRVEELPIVSSARVFADLRALGGRGEEAAAHLRDEVIVPQHRATTRRRPSSDLVDLDRDGRRRLRERVESEFGLAPTVYSAGAWSVAYTAIGSSLSLSELKATLTQSQGRETGWPPWWVPTRDEIRPRPREDGIECWINDNALTEAGHADFWRAEPGVRMFLLRGYQEDEITGDPGSVLDLTLPIWRVGECLLHASRMARYVSAPRIRFLVHWTGLDGRELRSITSPKHFMPPGRIAHQDEISTYVQATSEEIEDRLPSVVEALVAPLFELFDFFDPPLSLYTSELAFMRDRGL